MDKNGENTYFIKQLELYSNSIIGFIVIQGLAYCYKFGSDTTFSESVKANNELSVGLIIALTLVMILGLVATNGLGRRIEQRVQTENIDLIKDIYRGKMIVILIFGLLPVLVTLYFGIIEVRLLE